MPVTSIVVRLAGENSFNAPALSVTSKRPPGRKVIAHGSLNSPKPLDAKGGPSTRVIRGLLTSAALLSALASCPLLHRSEEHTSELQSLMRISYAVFCLKTQ